MILSDNSLRSILPVRPFNERTKHDGMTFGCGPAGYDVRIAQTVLAHPGRTVLASTVEEFVMPDNVLGVVHDKSTWARKGLSVQNTIIEPGWRGFLTLELLYAPLPTANEHWPLEIANGMPIAQIIFHWLDKPTTQPYDGKYQDQAAGPQPAIMEK